MYTQYIASISQMQVTDALETLRHQLDATSQSVDKWVGYERDQDACMRKPRTHVHIRAGTLHVYMYTRRLIQTLPFTDA